MLSLIAGNLPSKISRDEVLRVITQKLGKNVVTDLRLSLDENKNPRGFGYIELKEESMVEQAIRDLNGLDVGASEGLSSLSFSHCSLLFAPLDFRLSFVSLSLLHTTFDTPHRRQGPSV